MPHPFPNVPPHARGTVHTLRISSAALAGNPWGDPTDRDLHVYTPAGCDDGGGLPVLVVLAPFAGTGESLLARGLSEVSMATRADRLVAEGCPPFCVVLPDCMTSVVGSQYLDSPGTGNYATFLVDEVRPFVESRFRTNGRWGVLGRSSGGFGALRLAMDRPGAFQAVASHAGDMGFDLCYLGDIGPAIAGIEMLGGLETAVKRFWEYERPPGPVFAAMNLIAMACAYAPVPGGTPIPGRLPMDPATGAVDFSVLEAWRAHDPIVRVRSDAAKAALAGLELLFLDAGDRDEYHLQRGLRRFVAELGDVPHEHEEFRGGHRGTSHRYDVSLRKMATALT